MAEITKELGRISVTRGEYEASITYYKDNIVQYKRGSYQVVSESPIIGVPPTNDKNVVNPGWTLFAGTLDAQDVVNQIKEQEVKSIQAVAAREAEILAKSDAAAVSFNNTGTSFSGTNVQNVLEETDGKLSKLESEVIYDVTANNDGATFSSLSALLSSENLSTLIPTSVRHGGMSIRFVQSSDNKYVQYFLAKGEWSASEDDWEKMNLEDEVGMINNEVFGVKGNATFGYYLNSENSPVPSNDYCITDYIDAPSNRDIRVYFGTNSLIAYLCCLDSNDALVFTRILNQSSGGISLTLPDSVTKFRFTFQKDYSARVTSQGVDIYTAVITKSSLSDNIDNVKKSISDLRDAGYLYAGVAIPSSTPNDNEKVFYIASTEGTYANFNDIVLDENEVVILRKISDTWNKDYLAIKKSPSFTTDNLMNTMFNELFITPSIQWDSLYVQVISIDSNTWRFRFLKDNLASEYRVKDISKSDISETIYSIDNEIFFSINPASLLSTSTIDAHIELAKNPIYSPACATVYYNTAVSEVIDSLKITVNGREGNLTEGYYLDSSNTLVPSNDYAVSDYIAIPAGNFQVYYSDNLKLTGKYLCFVDDNETFIQYINLNVAGGIAVTIPANATKFRFTFVKDYTNARATYLSVPFYTPVFPIKSLDEKIGDTVTAIEEVNAIVDNVNKKIDGHTGNAEAGFYLNSIGGLTANEDWIVSDYIEVSSLSLSVYYSNQNEPGHYLVSYNSEGTIVDIKNLNGGYGALAVTLSSGATKIRCSFKKSFTNAMIMVNDVVIYRPDITLHSIIDQSKSYTDAQIAAQKVTSADPLMFTLIDDDFTNVTMCDKLALLCEELGIRCTFALIPDYTTDQFTPSLNPAKLAKIQDYQERGFSFAMHPNHNLFYMSDTPGTLEECEKCLVRTKQFFIDSKILGAEKILVWPGTSDTRNEEMLVPMSKRHVEIAIHAGTYGGQYYNTARQFKDTRYQLRRMPIDFGLYTKSQMKANIDTFVANGKGLMIFNCHVWQYVNDESTVDETTPSWANFSEVLTYVANKGIQFVNMNEVIYRKIEPEYMPQLQLDV